MKNFSIRNANKLAHQKGEKDQDFAENADEVYEASKMEEIKEGDLSMASNEEGT